LTAAGRFLAVIDMFIEGVIHGGWDQLHLFFGEEIPVPGFDCGATAAEERQESDEYGE
jgi:hypothetical protein